jgi:hypothetical protein
MTLKALISSLSDPEKEQFKDLITECLTREEVNYRQLKIDGLQYQEKERREIESGLR